MTANKCPSCGLEKLEKKSITHAVSGGNNTALIDVEVEICQKCGEILFTSEQVRYFEDIKEKLEKEDVRNFIQIGKNFKLK